jgi:hypothetical protein
MKLVTAILLLTSTHIQVYAQPVNWKKIEEQRADRVLIDPAHPPTKALLLGSFHFGYPNLDSHKTDSSKMIDVLSPQRQKEIRQLVDVLASFKPTRIYVESSNQPRIDSLYNAYREGKMALRRNEVDQVGFRLAKELNHPKVYAVDAGSFVGDNERKYTWIDSMWNNGAPVDSLRDKRWNGAYNRLYNAGDSTELVNTILESFLVMAEPLTLRRMLGNYLVGGFNTTGNSSPDVLAMWWYSRNLRIFNNILRTRPTSEDRILVIFGNGHMPIIKHCFESSPEFEVTELKDLTLKMQAAGKLK